MTYFVWSKLLIVAMSKRLLQPSQEHHTDGNLEEGVVSLEHGLGKELQPAANEIATG